MWEIDLVLQIKTSLYAVFMGFALSLLYDFLKAARLAFHPKSVIIAIEDVLYSLMGTVAVFCFLMLFTNGQPRGYVFLFTAAGFIIERLTLSPFTVRIIKAVLSVLRRANAKFCGAFFTFRKKTIKFVLKTLKNMQKTLERNKSVGV